MAKLTFINHASYVVESISSILIVDPWVEGTAFDNGWSLLDKSITNKALVKYLTKTDKEKYVWLSHEHSDHFSIPFMKSLNETKADIKFIFQKTLDGRVAQFIKKMGFSVIESNDKLEVLDAELSIVTFPHGGGDSYSLTMLNDFSILNINDCVIDDEAGAELVLRNYKKYTTNIDLLLTQFGYANWVGNQDEVQLREDSATEKLKRILLQVRKFDPKALVPFASFVYFSDPENFYTNDSQNTPEDVARLFEQNKILRKLVVLKPWDVLNLKNSLEQDLIERNNNISHWVSLFREINPQPANENKASLADIEKSYDSYRRKIFKHFLRAPSLLEKANFLTPIKFYLHDLDVNVVLSYREGLKIDTGRKQNCDISLSVSTLNFILRAEYGANTTHVNGKFERISDGGVTRFSRHFAPQEYMKMGYGLNHPVITLRVLPSKLFQKLLNKAWDLNPKA